MRKYKVIYLFVFIFILSGCSSASAPSNKSSDSYDVEPEAYSGIDNNYESPEAAYESEQSVDKSSLEEDSQLSEMPEKNDKKKIIIGDIRLEVENLNNTKSSIENITEASGGYIEKLQLYKQSDSSDFSATLRIPYEKYKEVKKQISDLGYVSKIAESEEDITKDYYSIKAELELKEEEVKMLEELLLQSQNIDEILMIENRLSIVRGDVNSNRYMLQNMDLVTSYSTINISVREVNYDVQINDELSGFGKKFNYAIKRSVSSTIIFFQEALLFFATYIFQMIVVIIIVFIIYKRVKRYGKSKDRIKKNKEISKK